MSHEVRRAETSYRHKVRPVTSFLDKDSQPVLIDTGVNRFGLKERVKSIEQRIVNAIEELGSDTEKERKLRSSASALRSYAEDEHRRTRLWRSWPLLAPAPVGLAADNTVGRWIATISMVLSGSSEIQNDRRRTRFKRAADRLDRRADSLKLTAK